MLYIVLAFLGVVPKPQVVCQLGMEEVQELQATTRTWPSGQSHATDAFSAGLSRPFLCFGGRLVSWRMCPSTVWSMCEKQDHKDLLLGEVGRACKMCPYRDGCSRYSDGCKRLTLLSAQAGLPGMDQPELDLWFGMAQEYSCTSHSCNIPDAKERVLNKHLVGGCAGRAMLPT